MVTLCNEYLCLFCFVYIYIISYLPAVCSGSEYESYTPICELSVPSSVLVRGDSFRYNTTPAVDDLDIYIANKTGCRYSPVVETGGPRLLVFSNQSFERPLEWHFALRARESADIYVKWGTDSFYGYRIGYNSNEETYFDEYYPRHRRISSVHTAGLLTTDGYTAFYLTLDGESLTMGVECESEPLFTHHVSIERGTFVELRAGTGTYFGVKLLSHCPHVSEAQCVVAPPRGVEYRCLESSSRNDVFRACKQFESAGSVAVPLCATNYYSPGELRHMHCVDGEWTNQPECTPECGTLTPVGEALAVGGSEARRGEVPWHAGIYSKATEPYENICGGSIVRPRLVISAAHCFWSGREGLPSASQYAVAVGKLHLEWDDAVDHAQKSDVLWIEMAARYRGASANYQHDVAVLALRSPVEYVAHVRPVCLDFEPSREASQLTTHNNGKVAGWGLSSSSGERSSQLRVLSLPYISQGECYERSPPTFRALLTSDKFCAGLHTGKTALCHGDSGGGLAFPADINGTTRYFLRGVVSTSPSGDEPCNTRTHTTFTRLQVHRDFILKFLDS